MAKFQIEYTDPQTGEFIITVKSFEPTSHITAREWAEDWAYTVSDKGPYKIEELRKCPK